MSHRLPQPAPKSSPTGCSHPVDGAGTRIPAFGTGRFGQALCDEPVEREGGLGGTHGENPPQPSTGPQLLGLFSRAWGARQAPPTRRDR